MYGGETGGYAVWRVGKDGEEDWCYEYVCGYGDGYGCCLGQGMSKYNCGRMYDTGAL